MRHLISAALISFGMATSAQAAVVDAPLTEVSGPGSTFYAIDLAALGLSQIAWIEIEDRGDNTSTRFNTGFDLDAIFLDADGDFSTTGDRTFASSFDVTLGAMRSPLPGDMLNNTNADGTVDFAAATLNAFDGSAAAGTGFYSMGTNGTLRANFAPAVPVTGTLFLFAGELGDREFLGRITVSDMPAVPLPAGGLLLLSGLAALGLRKRASA